MDSSVYEGLIGKGVLISPEIIEKKYDPELVKEVADFFGNSIDFLDEELVESFKLKKEVQKQNSIKVIKDYSEKPKKRSFQDFVKVFNKRFEGLSNILKARSELQSLTSIARLQGKESGDKVSIIGMVLEKSFTKANNIIVTVEDKSGPCKVIIRKEGDKDLYARGLDLVDDEVIGASGTWLGSALFPDDIYHPDVPLSKELKKSPEEEYVVFMGDMHFGSKHFMKKEFTKFLAWINGKVGNDEQKHIASKVKYIVMTGDLIEGAGTYPGQENDLEIIDVKEQYDDAAKWFSRIPSHIQMVTTTGNHDVGRLAEPQEKPYFEAAQTLYKMPNLRLVSNPALVRLGASGNFPGFDVLLYHGGSFIYYSENVPSIRAAGGQKRADLILKFLLERRHLAPTHGSTLIIPDVDQDYLLIDEVPDFLATGHIHRTSASTYKNVTALNTSCWTETTENQIKRGLEPQPGRAMIVNLQTRDVKVMNFLSKDQKEKEKLKAKKAKVVDDE